MSRINSHFTKIPDFIFDEVARIISGNEFKILLIVYRKTEGYQKESDQISYSQFMEYANISKSTVSQSVESLERKGYIKIDRSQITNRYTYCLPKRLYPSSSKIEQEVVHKSNMQLVRKSNIQKTTSKENKKRNTTSSDLPEEVIHITEYWKEVFDKPIDLSDDYMVNQIEVRLDHFGIGDLKKAIFNRSLASYYREKKPFLREKPSAFFPWPETVANDLHRKPDGIFSYDEMTKEVHATSGMTTDDFEIIPESKDEEGRPLWKLKKHKAY